MKGLFNIIHLIVVIPSLGYVGYSIYCNQKINEDIGLLIIFMTLLLTLLHIYMLYQEFKNNKFLSYKIYKSIK